MYTNTLRRAQSHGKLWRICAINAALATISSVLAQWVPITMAIFAVPGTVLAIWVLFQSAMFRAATIHYFRYLEWQNPPLTWQHIISAGAYAIAFIVLAMVVLTRTIEFTAPIFWMLTSCIALGDITWSVRSQFSMRYIYHGKKRELTAEQIDLLSKLEPIFRWKVIPEGRLKE